MVRGGHPLVRAVEVGDRAAQQAAPCKAPLPHLQLRPPRHARPMPGMREGGGVNAVEAGRNLSVEANSRDRGDVVLSFGI